MMLECKQITEALWGKSFSKCGIEIHLEFETCLECYDKLFIVNCLENIELSNSEVLVQNLFGINNKFKVVQKIFNMSNRMPEIF
jgi:hypothetical protein